jgi:hypothetical protein
MTKLPGTEKNFSATDPQGYTQTGEGKGKRLKEGGRPRFWERKITSGARRGNITILILQFLKSSSGAFATQFSTEHCRGQEQIYVKHFQF